MNPAQPVLIGYFPRRKAIPPGPQIPPQVVQLCNPGRCDGAAPANWVDAWRHNELGVYDSVSLAWSITPEQEREAFQVFAYRVFPSLVINGHAQALQLPKLKVAPLPRGWELLGFDPVTFHGLLPEEEGCMKTFGHSPLSPFCNGRCSDIPVNRFCLLDSAQDALMRSVEFSTGGGEPEPYVVVEVWRPSISSPNSEGEALCGKG